MSRTAIIVLNWNRPDLTLDCLDSLLPLLDRHRATVFLCDNGSSDDSLGRFRRWAARRFRQLRVAPERADFLLLATGCNRGYAGGNNAAIVWALRLGFDFVWLLNNDTRVFPEALQALLDEAAARPRVGAFGSTLVDAADPAMVQYAGGGTFNPWLTTFRAALAGLPLRQAMREVGRVLDYPAGAAWFLRAEAIRRVGLLNESFFLYYEELDYSRRLRALDYDIAWCRFSIVAHRGGASVASASAHYHENLSTLKYLWQHHPAAFPCGAVVRFFGKLFVLFRRGEWVLLPSLLQAYRDFRPCRFHAEETPARLLLAASRLIRARR